MKRRTYAEIEAQAIAQERERTSVFLTSFAARLRTGPRKREGWEQPISPHQYAPEVAGPASHLIDGLAGSIAAGLHHQETDGHGERSTQKD